MKKQFAIKQLVPVDIYTDRQDYLVYFYIAAIKIVLADDPKVLAK